MLGGTVSSEVTGASVLGVGASVVAGTVPASVVAGSVGAVVDGATVVDAAAVVDGSSGVVGAGGVVVDELSADSGAWVSVAGSRAAAGAAAETSSGASEPPTVPNSTAPRATILAALVLHRIIGPPTTAPRQLGRRRLVRH